MHSEHSEITVTVKFTGSTVYTWFGYSLSSASINWLLSIRKPLTLTAFASYIALFAWSIFKT